MIVSAERRVVFVHVQKTGGQSISKLLLAQMPGARKRDWMLGGKHATLTTLLKASPELGEHFVFGFVRNPWARLLSWHQMVLRRAGAGDPRLPDNAFWAGVVERYPDFESFVLEAPREFKRLRTPQLDYLRAGDREADFIGRTERMDEDVRELCPRLGIEVTSVPRHNADPAPRPYRDFYTPPMRRRVARLFEEDIRRFDYEF